MASATMRTALMTSVYQGKPTKNYATATKHNIGNGGAGQLLAYIYFSRPMPIGATILTARLVMYSDTYSGSGNITLTAKRLRKSAPMTKVTWKTRVTDYYTTPPNATVTRAKPLPAGAEWSFDVTAQMQSVANGEAWYGWEITGDATPSQTIFGPKWKTSNQRPRLEVTWAMLPTPPSALSPGGGRLVGVTRPTLRATYTDVGADNPLASLQVQRNVTNDFTGAVTWDSGEVAATSAQLDTSTTSWPALTSGSVFWWRMRVRDVNGLWSPWSSAESFGYQAKPALTLTAPGAAPNNYVNDDSPPVGWSFGGTQTAYQIVLSDPGSGRQLWSSGKVSATTDGFTIPAGYIKSQTTTYRVTVNVWDDQQRETTPGDPAYSSASQDFTYALTNTVTPTSALSATSDTYSPRVSLSWSRPTFPDSFTVLRNNLVIASELAANDYSVTSTTFTWTDPAPLPNIAATYEVSAVVNGKSSSGNATSTVAATVQGAWLANADRTIEVPLVGRGERAWTFGEQSEVLEVIGGTEVVVVTHGQRGLEGVIVGQLRGNVLGQPGVTVLKSRLLALKARAGLGETLWLTAGDQTIPVSIRQVNVTPRPEPVLSYDVSFEFYQVGTTVLVSSAQTGSFVVDPGTGIPYYSDGT